MAKKPYKRELIEWTVLIVVVGTLYLTGLHTEVIGQVQRVVLATGIIQPDLDQENTNKAAYNFKLLNAAGREVDFAEFEGKTVFLNFWATWCPPCIAEMPDIEALYEQMGNDVSFVMISLDEEQNKAKKFIDRKGFEMPVYFLESQLPAAYASQSIPTTFIISPKGEIVLKRSGMAKYNTEDFRSFLLNL